MSVYPIPVTLSAFGFSQEAVALARYPPAAPGTSWEQRVAAGAATFKWPSASKGASAFSYGGAGTSSSAADAQVCPHI